MSKYFSVQKLTIVVLSVIFIYGAALHVYNPREMLRAIEGFQFVHGGWAMLGAYWIPWVELWAGFWILTKRFRAASALLIFGLMALFTIATIAAWARGINLNCGCFGFETNEPPDDYRWLILRDVGLLILSGYVFLTRFLGFTNQKK